MYLATGAKITSKLSLGSGCTIGANAVVNKSFGNNCLLVGIPAENKKEIGIWHQNSGEEFKRRVCEVEKLKTKYGIK